MFGEMVGGNRELRGKVWVDVGRLNLAENKFGDLVNLP